MPVYVERNAMDDEDRGLFKALVRLYG